MHLPTIKRSGDTPDVPQQHPSVQIRIVVRSQCRTTCRAESHPEAGNWEIEIWTGLGENNL